MHAGKGRGHPSNLCSTVCDQIIELRCQKALSIIVDEIKLAKYLSLSVDSTPDIAHVDQLTVIDIECCERSSVKQLLKFILVFSHAGAEMVEIVLQFLDEHSINIEDCRGLTVILST